MAKAAHSIDNGTHDLDVFHLYRSAGEAYGVDGLAGVDEQAISFYRDAGYLVVRGAFSRARITTALQEIDGLIDGAYPGFSGVQYSGSVRERIDQLTKEERRDAIRKLSGFLPFAEELRSICEDQELRSVIAGLVGAPVNLYENDGQAHLKPPRIGREKPWHQDHAYFNLPMGTPIVGVWIALDRATPENGCMHVIPGSHREGPTVHFKRRDWQICDTSVAVERAVAAVLDPGDLLFFDGLIHHGTPPNVSEKRRRAIQFHYNRTGAELISTEQRMEVFGSEGKDVEC